MKRDFLIHFIYFLSFFLFLTLLKRWFNPSYIFFWLGGIIGTTLPLADYLIYIYITHPQDSFSQKVSSYLSQKDFNQVFYLISEAKRSLPDLIIHRAFFQVVFVVFSFLIIASSGLLAKGLVLGFLNHLLIDEVSDFIEKKYFENWFSGFPINLNEGQRKFYLFANLFVIFVYGLLL